MPKIIKVENHYVQYYHHRKQSFKRFIGPTVYIFAALFAVYFVAGKIADKVCTAEENSVYYAQR